MQTLIKQPSEVLKPQLAFPASAVLVQLLGVNSASRGLVAGSAALGAIGAIVGGVFSLTLTGGTDGERYLVTGRAATDAGEELEAELDVVVIEGRWTTPDGGVPYLSVTEFVGRFGVEEAVRMTDVAGDGRIDREMLVAALADAQATVDVHVAAKYAVPLSTVPAAVKTAVADIARARLYPRGAPEGVADNAKAAVRLLERISEGKLPLPVDTPIAASPSAAPVAVAPGTRQYADGLKDY